jgi:hypothetical protein
LLNALERATAGAQAVAGIRGDADRARHVAQGRFDAGLHARRMLEIFEAAARG